MSASRRGLLLAVLVAALPLGGCAAALCREEAPVSIDVVDAPAEGVTMVVHHDKTGYDRVYEGLSSLSTTLPRDGTYAVTISTPGRATERVRIHQAPNNVVLLDLLPVAAGVAIAYLGSPTNLNVSSFVSTIAGGYGTVAIATGLVALGVDAFRGYAWTLSPDKTEVRLDPIAP